MYKVEKRNGSVVDFEAEKIANAVKSAMRESEKGIDEDLAREISESSLSYFKDKDIVNVEEIQDFVEVELMKSRPEVARLYILYRDEQTRLREEGWEMTDLQRDIYEKKYRFDGESFEEFLDRVSGGNNFIKKAIKKKKLMPAGRVLAGRGLSKLGRKITLSNCYVLPKVEDSIEDIFDTAKHLARTYSYGGGVGLNISKLRPKGSHVNNAAITTTGAVSFMDLFSLVTGLIGMKGRRGALMLNMDINHPDIMDFIDVKNDLSKVNYANLSVNISNEFMEAVKNDEEFKLSFHVEPSGEDIVKVINARELFRKICYNNWNMAEPGVLFQDRINSWHIMSEDDNFEFAGVNPCAEETLPAYGSCNLCSINLSEFVKKPFTPYSYFDFSEFAQTVNQGIRFLNELLDENMNLHPLPEQREVSKNLRQIGLGIMGLSDMFIKMSITYGDRESIKMIHKIGHLMINEALKASAMLAKEEGTFPLYKKEAIINSEFIKSNAEAETLELIEKYGLRNSQLLTIPPTGSISTLIGCSNGVEPLFQVSYTRKSESLYEVDTFYKVYSPIVKEYMKANHIVSIDTLPDYFITADNLDYEKRIEVQAAWQKYIDASISSTVNVANDFTVEEVENLYVRAWEKGLKGVTIYRAGCARSGVLFTQDKKSSLERIEELKREIDTIALEELRENPDICPMCGGVMNHTGGCSECQDCGFSPCSI